MSRAQYSTSSPAAPDDIASRFPEDRFQLSQEFWDLFMTSFWNKKPVLMKRPFAEPLLTEPEMFDILCRHSDDYRSRKKRFLKVYVDNGQRFCGLSELLPAADDETFHRFTQRVRNQLGDKETAFFFFECHVYHPELWLRVRRFLNPLIDRIGVPAAAIDVDIVAGKYERTPTGIHKDAATNFSYIASGEKRMLFWPSEVFSVGGASVQLGEDCYERFLDQAIDIYAEAGDIIFWPPSYWHLAASRDGQYDWATTVNIAIYQEMMPSHLIQKLLSSVGASWLRKEWNQPFGPCHWETGGKSGRPRVQDTLELQVALIDSLSSAPELKTFLEDMWLRKASASGFVTTPPPRRVDEAEFASKRRFLVDRDSRVYLSPYDSHTSKLFVNGVCVSVRHSDAVHTLVETIKTQSTLQLASSAPPDGDVMRVLRILYAMRVIQ